MLFAPWAGARKILAAVSGGPDSMALLHMLAQWCGHLSGRPELFVATVDHALRQESAAEAVLVANFAQMLGTPHTTLVWENPRKESRLQEAARAARYQLLAAHAAKCGADVLMTAHHAGDQAETILYRLLRGSGVTGLGGMAAERPLGKLRLARPLLEFSKDMLVDYCHTKTIPYVEDPGNQQSRFARVRMRRLIATMEEEGIKPEDWTRLARRMRRAGEALETAAAAAEKRWVSGTLDVGVTVDFEHLAQEPDEIVLRVIVSCVQKFSPGTPIRFDRAEKLAVRLKDAACSRSALTATLGNASIRLNAKGILTLVRQPERRRGRPHSEPPPEKSSD
ncbi:MAG: tRNA lysidine(34) synthetase TilS [Beijerinckiaceae bacterium]